MSGIVVFTIGIVGGILFSFAFPEPSMAVNETLSPMVTTTFNFIVDVLKDAIGGVLT